MDIKVAEKEIMDYITVNNGVVKLNHVFNTFFTKLRAIENPTSFVCNIVIGFITTDQIRIDNEGFFHVTINESNVENFLVKNEGTKMTQEATPEPTTAEKCISAIAETNKKFREKNKQIIIGYLKKRPIVFAPDFIASMDEKDQELFDDLDYFHHYIEEMLNDGFVYKDKDDVIRFTGKVICINDDDGDICNNDDDGDNEMKVIILNTIWARNVRNVDDIYQLLCQVNTKYSRDQLCETFLKLQSQNDFEIDSDGFLCLTGLQCDKNVNYLTKGDPYKVEMTGIVETLYGNINIFKPEEKKPEEKKYVSSGLDEDAEVIFQYIKTVPGLKSFKQIQKVLSIYHKDYFEDKDYLKVVVKKLKDEDKVSFNVKNGFNAKENKEEIGMAIKNWLKDNQNLTVLLDLHGETILNILKEHKNLRNVNEIKYILNSKGKCLTLREEDIKNILNQFIIENKIVYDHDYGFCVGEEGSLSPSPCINVCIAIILNYCLFLNIKSPTDFLSKLVPEYAKIIKDIDVGKFFENLQEDGFLSFVDGMFVVNQNNGQTRHYLHQGIGGIANGFVKTKYGDIRIIDNSLQKEKMTETTKQPDPIPMLKQPMKSASDIYAQEKKIAIILNYCGFYVITNVFGFYSKLKEEYKLLFSQNETEDLFQELINRGMLRLSNGNISLIIGEETKPYLDPKGYDSVREKGYADTSFGRIHIFDPEEVDQEAETIDAGEIELSPDMVKTLLKFKKRIHAQMGFEPTTNQVIERMFFIINEQINVAEKFEMNANTINPVAGLDFNSIFKNHQPVNGYSPHLGTRDTFSAKPYKTGSNL